MQIKEVARNMHARHHATGRTYVYRINCPTALHTLSVFEFNRTWAYDGQLDTQAMNEAASLLVGKHDFSTFRGSGELLQYRFGSKYWMLFFGIFVGCGMYIFWGL